MTVKAAFISILSVVFDMAQLQTWCYYSDCARRATFSHEGGKTKSKMLKQKGNLLWSGAGKPRDILSLDQPGSHGSRTVCRPGLLHLSTLLSFRLAPFSNGLFPCIGKMTCAKSLNQSSEHGSHWLFVESCAHL